MSTHRYNPYIAGNPLRREQDFLGREQVLARVASALRIPSVNSLVLFGQRRIGKTSILYHLERTLPHDQFAPVYFDLQAFARRPVGELLAELAAVIADRTDFEEPSAENFDDRGRYFTQIFLPQLYQHLPAGVRPVFLLDEFDVLDSLSAQDLPRTSAAVAFFPFLSRLMQEDPRPIFVFVFGRHQDDLAIDFTATFKASLTQEIWTLEPSEAEQLVRQAEGNDSLRFTAEAVSAILETTNCHPYLTQLLCQRIWERAYRTQLERAPEITAEHIREAIPDALEAGSQALVWLWDGLSAAEKIYAAALAEITAPGQTISEAEIVNTLTANATRLRTREVEQAPTDLVKRRILTQTAEQVYTFTIPLFHEWVSQRKTLREVKDELDRRDPLAEQYYNLGHQEFASGNWEAALRNYDDALQRNSQHFRARLERAEALLELGQLEAGLEELRRAYGQDKREARYALVRGLRQLAEQQAQAGDETAVMATYEEILEISPKEQFAREFLWRVWEARGDKAAEVSQFAEAIAAYEQMGQYQQTAEEKETVSHKLTAAHTEQAVHELLRKVQAEESQASWQDVLQLYEQLLAEFPSDNRRVTWQAQVESAREEAELIQQFHLAQSNLEKREWAMAQTLLDGITSRRAGYSYQGQSVGQLSLLAQWEAAGDTAHQQGDWLTSMAKYDYLLTEFGNHPRQGRWQEKRQEALLAQRGTLKDLFANAQNQLARGELAKAQQSLAKIIYTEPEYAEEGQYAADLLVGAIRKKSKVQNGNGWGWHSYAAVGTLLLVVLLAIYAISSGRLADLWVASAEPTPVPTMTVLDPDSPPIDAQLGDEWVRPKDGMVMVFVPPPSQPFALGSGLEAPTEGYWIDKYEVTNAQYKLCVADEACAPSIYADNTTWNGANYPAVGVSWYDAVAYAKWVGAALPNEEQWEYAATGEEGLLYPWGNEFDGTRLNCGSTDCPNDGYQDTAPVGSYSTGASWVGALDMAGNVREWTSSPYSESSTTFVLRGGSWNNNQNNVRASNRNWINPDIRLINVGFRLVSPIFLSSEP